jgi:hypothetical protein
MTGPRRISRFHYTDLCCAAMNDRSGDSQKIFDDLGKNGWDIVEDMSPEESRFYDYSIRFMYPHQISLINILGENHGS